MNGCSGITEIGNEVTLGNAGYQKLANVVVGIRNRGPEVNPGGSPNSAITVTVSGHSVTGYPDIAPGNPNANLSDGDRGTFDFTGTTIFVPQTFTYGISFPDNTETASLNVAHRVPRTN